MRLATLLLLATLPALPQDASALVSQLLHRAEIRGKGRLVVTSAAKQQRVYQLSLTRKLGAQAATSVIAIEGGPRITIESRFDGPPRIYQDSDAVVPPRRWSEPVVAGDFTLEDLAEPHLSWAKQTILRSEPCGEHQCAVLRSVPPNGAATSYTSITSWIDQTALLAVRVIKERKGAPPKLVTARGIRRVGKTWGASTVEVRTEGAQASTRMVFTSR